MSIYEKMLDMPSKAPIVEANIEHEHPLYSPRLRRCSTLRDGKSLHAQIPVNELDRCTILANQVMAMYSRLHSPENARLVFKGMHHKNVFSWATIIAAYAQNGHYKEALNLFYTMEVEGVQANGVVLVTVVGACTRLGHLRIAKAIHWIITESGIHDVVIGTSILHMYGKCGDLQQARNVFDAMPFRNVITWNAMIKAYAQAGHLEEAMKLFEEMDTRANNITFTSMLRACTRRNDLEATRAVHQRARELRLDDDELVVSALVDTYAKCGSFEDARAAFEKLKAVDLVCWTAMVGAYTQFGYPQETLALFRRMDLEGVRADAITYVNVLSACGTLGLVAQGDQLRDRIVSEGLIGNEVVLTALSTMYRKCGNLKDGAICATTSSDVVRWNGMISAYAQHGKTSDGNVQDGQTPLELLWEMLLHGVQSGRITYVSALHGCSHKGLLYEARDVFLMLQEEGEIEAAAEHYLCIADALGRVGRLREAKELLQFMPFEPGADAWRTLLAASVLHGDSSHAEAAAAATLRIAPHLREAYIMFSNSRAQVPAVRRS